MAHRGGSTTSPIAACVPYTSASRRQQVVAARAGPTGRGGGAAPLMGRPDLHLPPHGRPARVTATSQPALPAATSCLSGQPPPPDAAAPSVELRPERGRQMTGDAPHTANTAPQTRRHRPSVQGL